MAPPTAPSMLPQYIADGLPKQDDETLRDTQHDIDQLIADRERRREEPVTEDELPDDIDVVEEGLSGTVYHEYCTCGDDTCRCMTGGPKHGLYAYRVYRDGDTFTENISEKPSRSEPMGMLDGSVVLHENDIPRCRLERAGTAFRTHRHTDAAGEGLRFTRHTGCPMLVN